MGVFLFNHNLWYGSPYIHPDVVYVKRDLYQRLWINKKRPKTEVVDE
jgi:hypothetical protein